MDKENENMLYKTIVKIGKGGFLCTCCNPWYYERKHGKPVMHRLLRRRMKQHRHVTEYEV